MRLLDLFCGAGGAAMGYSRAGFIDIVGVDIAPQKRYPFTFVQADALEYLADCGKDFDVIHASPPCQRYTALRTMWDKREHADLVEPTRSSVGALHRPWVIENVPGSPLARGALMLCGTMFGLGTADGRAELRRHRYFELSNPASLTPACRHGAMTAGVYGGHGRDRRRLAPKSVGVYGHAGGRSVRDGAQQFSTRERAEAMGIDWMTGNELSQAIPPAYTEFIGRQLIAGLGHGYAAYL